MEDLRASQVLQWCEGVVPYTTCTGHDSGSLVPEIHSIRSGVGAGKQPSPGHPHAPWSLRTTKLHRSQFCSIVFSEDLPHPSPSTSLYLLSAPLMFWSQSCPLDSGLIWLMLSIPLQSQPSLLGHLQACTPHPPRETFDQAWEAPCSPSLLGALPPLALS